MGVVVVSGWSRVLSPQGRGGGRDVFLSQRREGTKSYVEVSGKMDVMRSTMSTVRRLTVMSPLISVRRLWIPTYVESLRI